MFTLSIDTGNAAMRTTNDVAEAIERVAAVIADSSRYADDGIIRDLNGNTVGKWAYQLDLTEDEDDE